MVEFMVHYVGLRWGMYMTFFLFIHTPGSSEINIESWNVLVPNGSKIPEC